MLRVQQPRIRLARGDVGSAARDERAKYALCVGGSARRSKSQGERPSKARVAAMLVDELLIQPRGVKIAFQPHGQPRAGLQIARAAGLLIRAKRLGKLSGFLERCRSLLESPSLEAGIRRGFTQSESKGCCPAPIPQPLGKLRRLAQQFRIVRRHFQRHREIFQRRFWSAEHVEQLTAPSQFVWTESI